MSPDGTVSTVVVDYIFSGPWSIAADMTGHAVVGDCSGSVAKMCF